MKGGRGREVRGTTAYQSELVEGRREGGREDVTDLTEKGSLHSRFPWSYSS